MSDMAGKSSEPMVLDEAALKRCLAKGAGVEIVAVEGGEDEKNLREILSKYISLLNAHEQEEEADAIRRLLHEWQ
jgi:5S rRNA maturation endonuclease (ribonuclease M5)